MMKKVVLCVGMVLMGLGLVAVPVYADATNVCDDEKISDELKEIAGCNVEKEDTVMPIAINIIQVVLSIVGILTVGMIIYGGIQYVISNGDAAKLQKAKNTILYGVVGLVVSMLAFGIVTYISQSIWG